MAIESQCLTFQVTSWREYCNYRLRGPFTCLLVMVLRLYVIFTFIWRWGGVLHTACGTSQTSDWIHDPYIQFSSVTESCPTLCNPMNCSTPGLPIHHQLPEFTQTYVDQVGDAIQPSYPLSSPSPPALNPSQHQGLFQWVSSLHQVAQVLEFQLQHQSFQWTPRTDLL